MSAHFRWSQLQQRQHRLQHQQQGLSLVEILVATTLVGLILTAVSTLLTLSIKNAAQSRHRETATQLAQDGMEFFNRAYGQQAWSNFAGVFPENTSTYCLEVLPTTGDITGLDPDPCASNQEIEENGGVFIRQAVVDKSSSAPDELKVTINTSWVDADRTVTVDVTRVFRRL